MQCLFHKNLLKAWRELNRIWTLLGGVEIWCLWIKRNLKFDLRSGSNLIQDWVIWFADGTVDCGRLEWMKPVQLIHKIILLKINTCIILTRGDALHFTLCARDNWTVCWNCRLPNLINLFWSVVCLWFSGLPIVFFSFAMDSSICSKNKIKQWQSIPWSEFACSRWEAENALKRAYLFPLGRGEGGRIL